MGIEGNRPNCEDPYGTGIEAHGPAGIEAPTGFDTALFPLIQSLKSAALRAVDKPEEAPQEEDATSFTLVVPYQWPGRWDKERTEIEIPNIPVVAGEYDGFATAMTTAGFHEYQEGKKGTIRFPQMEDGKRAVVMHPGDFHRIGTVRRNVRDLSRRITFPGLTAEAYTLNSVGAWGNFLILSEKITRRHETLTLVDLKSDTYRILQEYPMERLVQNPLSRYLPTQQQ